MKTITYYRTKRGPHGIIYEQARGYEYAISNEKAVARLAIGKTASGDGWTITHIGSGYLASPQQFFPTRRAAVESITPGLIDKIIDLLLTPAMIGACDRLTEYLNNEKTRAS